MEKKLHNNPKLYSYSLHQSNKIKEARRLVEEAVREAQAQIVGLRPPLEEQKEDFKTLLEDFGRIRGGSLFFPYISSGFGKGPFVELLDGSVKYDCISGIGAHYWGHSDLEIIDASFESMLGDTVMQGHLQQTADSYTFSKLLLESSHLDHCFLTSSGAMANENALKIAFAARPGSERILAFEHNFCGRSLALASISDKPQYRMGIPITVPVDYLPFFDPQEPQISIDRCVFTLKKFLRRYPGKYAACLIELVQGEGGFYPGSRDFFSAVLEVLKKENVVVIADEVQTFGRTYELFAYQHFGVEKYIDIVTVGKLTQVCATLYRSSLQPKPGLLSQTFTSSSSAIKTGCVIIKGLLEGNYFGQEGKIAAFHHLITTKLKNLQKEGFPIKGPFGMGMMIAFTPFFGEKEKAANLVRKLFDNGVITFTAGENPTRVRFLFPVNCIKNEHIEEIFSILKRSFQELS